MLLARVLWSGILSGLLVASCLAQTAERVPPGALPRASTITAEQIDAAIARGVAQLLSTQNKDTGRFGQDDSKAGARTYPGGNDVMALTALAYAHETAKPEFQKGLAALREMELDTTYVLALRLVLSAELYRQADHKGDAAKKTGLRSSMATDVKKLVSFQLPSGAWDYVEGKKGGGWDFSNTQLAVLGIQQAMLCGVEVGIDPLVKVQKLYLDKQREDGGWNYGRGGQWEGRESYGSMTAAATASLLITRDLLDPANGCPCQGEHSPGRHSQLVQAAIDRGVKWLGENFRAGSNPKSQGMGTIPYWLYAVERVGIATGNKYLGSHAWYFEGAQTMMGQMGGGAGNSSIPDTAFAVLFLIKGRGPLLMNKLQYDGPWDLHPHDVEFLARYVGDLKEQTMTWQVVSLTAPVEELHDAPILFISMENELKLSDADKKKLRDFTDSGGTILFEASCGNHSVDKAWRKACQEIWPEWEIKKIDKAHPLWTADLKMPSLVPLWGLSDGVRTFMFYSPTDISCVWGMNALERNKGTFELGCNLYAYTTDRGKLRSRMARHDSSFREKYIGGQPRRGDAELVTVARIQHGGDWNVARNYYLWETLSEATKKELGLTVKEAAPLVAGAAIPPETTMLYLNGRNGCDLDESALAWLKKYLAGGGFLFAEATLGGRRFDEQLRIVLPKAGLTLKRLESDNSFSTGSMTQVGGGYFVKNLGFTAALRGERIGKPDPEFLGIFLGEKMVGVYSPFDIMYCQTGAVAFDCRGYAWEDARALAMNLAIYASALTTPAQAAAQAAAASASSASPAEQ